MILAIDFDVMMGWILRVASYWSTYGFWQLPATSDILLEPLSLGNYSLIEVILGRGEIRVLGKQ